MNKEFTKLVLNEQFDNTDKWNTTFNLDNLFIGQNGFYELFRQSKKTGYYVIPEYKDEYSSFQFECSFSFSKHQNNKQSFGVVLMANSENSNGILIEFNQKKSYRIQRIFKDKQIPIDGLPSNWVKTTNGLTKFENNIVIKTHNKVYDLYINGIFISTFSDIELNKGKIGLFIGPDSKAKVDYIKVLIEDKQELKDIDNTNSKQEELAFTQIIIKLKDQINRKDKEIDELKTKLKLSDNTPMNRGIDTATLNQKNRCQAKVSVLEDEIEELTFKISKLEEENLKLKEFKTSVEKGQDEGDIVINLSNMVSNQKKNIELLENKNKVLNNENNSLFLELKQMTKTLDKTTNDLTNSKELNKSQSIELDSLKVLIQNLKDSLAVKNKVNTENETPEKPLSEEEQLQKMIEKEREERRKRLEELEKK